MAEINVTPWSTSSWSSLIIFMVTAPMMQQGLDVNLCRRPRRRPFPPKKKR